MHILQVNRLFTPDLGIGSGQVNVVQRLTARHFKSVLLLLLLNTGCARAPCQWDPTLDPLWKQERGNQTQSMSIGQTVTIHPDPSLAW